MNTIPWTYFLTVALVFHHRRPCLGNFHYIGPTSHGYRDIYLSQRVKEPSSRWRRSINNSATHGMDPNHDDSGAVGDLDLTPEGDQDSHPEAKANYHRMGLLANRMGTQSTIKCCPSPWSFTAHGCLLVDHNTCGTIRGLGGCNWFQARQSCQDQGGSLWPFRDDTGSRGVLELLRGSASHEKNGTFWIGMKINDENRVVVSKTGKQPAVEIWCSGFPKEARQCVQARHTEGSICWENELCHQLRVPMCHRDYDTVNCTQDDPRDDPALPINKQSNGTPSSTPSQYPGQPKSTMKVEWLSTTRDPSAPGNENGSENALMPWNKDLKEIGHEVGPRNDKFPASSHPSQDQDEEQSAEGMEISDHLGPGLEGRKSLRNRTSQDGQSFWEVIKRIKIIERMEKIVVEQAHILKDIKAQYIQEDPGIKAGTNGTLDSHGAPEAPNEGGKERSFRHLGSVPSHESWEEDVPNSNEIIASVPQMTQAPLPSASLTSLKPSGSGTKSIRPESTSKREPKNQPLAMNRIQLHDDKANPNLKYIPNNNEKSNLKPLAGAKSARTSPSSFYKFHYI